MTAKIFVFDQIKKFMGWCPYAKNVGAGPRLSPENFEANDRSGGEKGDRPGREKTPIKRNSKKFIILFFGSVCIIITSIAATMMESLMDFPLVLMGFGLLLFILSISETNVKTSKLLSIWSDIFGSAMCFGVYFYFKSSGSVLTAKLFVLLGVYGAAKAIYSTVSIYKKGPHKEAF
jgi:hypothetical protein